MITVASGGMYLERLEVDALQSAQAEYDGVKAYAHRSGLFFLDRQERPMHRKRSTQRLDEASERARLWELCQKSTDSFSGRDRVS